MREIIKELNVKLIGHYRYYGVTWNFRKITTFLHRVQQFLFKAMNRRGCRRAYTWNGFVEMLKYYPLAKPKTYYCLYWSECYYEEPYAGKPHVRICEGLRLRGLSLLDCQWQVTLKEPAHSRCWLFQKFHSNKSHDNLAKNKLLISKKCEYFAPATPSARFWTPPIRTIAPLDR